MGSIKSFVLFGFFFVHLIAGVNHDKENSTNPLNPLIFNESDISESSVSINYDSICSPYDSCSGRCGDQPNVLSYACNCDQQCSVYGDCCSDFETKCLSNETEIPKVKDPQMTCEMFFDSYPLFSKSECSELWENTTESCSRRVSSECVLASSIFSSSELGLTAAVKSQCESLVYSECAERFGEYCDAAVEPRCEALSKRECRRMSVSRCRGCETSLWPVVDADGTLYPNSHCAECNFRSDYTVLDFETLTKIVLERNGSDVNVTARGCFVPDVRTCPPENASSGLSGLCGNASGPVVSSWMSGVVYKNVYCALCNGVEPSELECVGINDDYSGETSLMRGVEYRVMDFVTGIANDIQGLRLDDIPAAFSMLLNFGLDGRQRVYISSEEGKALTSHQEECGPAKIWDPFSKICRLIHCSTEFMLVDYQCVKNEDSNNTVPMEKEIEIPDAAADHVHLSFSAEMELIDILIFANQELEQIHASIREAFSAAFDIRIERIRNVAFNVSLLGNITSKEDAFRIIDAMDDYSLVNFTFSMDLHEPASRSEEEPSVDSVVSMMASALSYNGFQLGINNTVSRIYQIQQSVDYLTSWCSPDVGVKRTYWNSEFRLVLYEDNSTLDNSTLDNSTLDNSTLDNSTLDNSTPDNSTTNNSTLNVRDRVRGIYVNKTGRFYPKGSFIADILYQGVQFRRELINVSGVAVVCDTKLRRLNSSCPRVVLQKHEYSVSPNGSLWIHNPLLREGVDETVYERTDNDSLLVCLSPELSIRPEVYRMDMDFTQGVVTYVLSWVSIVAMVIVLATYSLFPSLRNLPGCNTMNLTCSLIVMQVTFVFGQRRTVTGGACKAVACLFHYEILCCFMWMNVIAYDLYKTFGGDKSTLSTIRSKGRYLPLYLGYAYGVPLLVVALALLLDHFCPDWSFSPHYGAHDICWITTRHAAAVYFAAPLAVLTLVDLAFFVMTIASISGAKHLLGRSSHSHRKKGKSDVLLYARMAAVIGLTWALAFAAAFANEQKLAGLLLTYLFIVFNTLQGVFIFVVFVCNRRVMELYLGAFRKAAKKLSGQTTNNASGGTSFKGISHIIERSVSTNTIMSTVSNASSNDPAELPAIREED